MMSMISMMSVMANILIMVKISSGTSNTEVSENHQQTEDMMIGEKLFVAQTMLI